MGDTNFDRIYITNKTIRAGHQTYQISNLTSIGKYKIEKKSKVSDFFEGVMFLFAVAAALIAAIIIFFVGEFDYLIKIVFPCAGFAAACFQIAEYFKIPPSYALSIETNSGSSNLFSSKNEGFINNLVELLHGIMENQKENISYVVNIKEQNVNQNTAIGNGPVNQTIIDRSSNTSMNNSGTVMQNMEQKRSDFAAEILRKLTSSPAENDVNTKGNSR
jgi:hypothetical protein